MRAIMRIMTVFATMVAPTRSPPSASQEQTAPIVETAQASAAMVTSRQTKAAMMVTKSPVTAVMPTARWSSNTPVAAAPASAKPPCSAPTSAIGKTTVNAMMVALILRAVSVNLGRIALIVAAGPRQIVTGSCRALVAAMKYPPTRSLFGPANATLIANRIMTAVPIAMLSVSNGCLTKRVETCVGSF